MGPSLDLIFIKKEPVVNSVRLVAVASSCKFTVATIGPSSEFLNGITSVCPGEVEIFTWKTLGNIPVSVSEIMVVAPTDKCKMTPAHDKGAGAVIKLEAFFLVLQQGLCFGAYDIGFLFYLSSTVYFVLLSVSSIPNSHPVKIQSRST